MERYEQELKEKMDQINQEEAAAQAATDAENARSEQAGPAGLDTTPPAVGDEAAKETPGADGGDPQPKGDSEGTAPTPDLFDDLRKLDPVQVEAQLAETTDPAERLRIKRFQTVYEDEERQIQEFSFDPENAEVLKDPINRVIVETLFKQAQTEQKLPIGKALAWAKAEAKKRGITFGTKKPDETPDPAKLETRQGPAGVGLNKQERGMDRSRGGAPTDLDSLALADPVTAEAEFGKLSHEDQQRWLQGEAI